jgi:hypothetical protein
MTNVLSLCFKGERSYLQGGDIYNAVGAFLQGRGETEISEPMIVFHKLAAHQLTAELVGDGKSYDSVEEPVAHLAYTVNGERRKLAVCETTEEINCRNPYPEETITHPATVDLETKIIYLTEPMPYSDIEIATALNKELLKKLYPENPGKWYLTRFQATGYSKHTPYRSFEVKLEHNLNFKLTKSSILIDNRLYGYIFFSLR